MSSLSACYIYKLWIFNDELDFSARKTSRNSGLGIKNDSYNQTGFRFFNYSHFNYHNYLIFNVLKIFLYIFDIEIHTNVFMRHKTPLKQVRFKKIPPWFAFEPSLFRTWTKLGWNSNQGTILRKQAWFKGGVCRML